jgi:hypothetical protein
MGSLFGASGQNRTVFPSTEQFWNTLFPSVFLTVGKVVEALFGTPNMLQTIKHSSWSKNELWVKNNFTQLSQLPICQHK